MRRQNHRYRFGVIFIVALLVSTAAGAQESRWKELDAQAGQLRKQGKNTEALPVAQEALRVAEATFGSEQPNTATALGQLGVIYTALGKYADAEPLLKRSLVIREKSLGPDHSGVAESLHDLAGLYEQMGKYEEAEPLLKRSLTIREKALGPDSLEAAQSLNILARLCVERAKYAEAEPLFRRSLAIREKALGPDHPDVATSLNNLAGLYWAEGKFAEAEPLVRQSLAISEKSLGPDHPDVAKSLNGLGLLYRNQGKYAEAEPLFRRSLAIREKVLGADHPDVATSLNSLAALYELQGKYSEAEPLYKRSLAIREKALGPDHPNVAQSLNTLAALYEDEGKYAEAEPLYKRSVAIGEKVLGPDHPSLATSLNNLAELYNDEGKYAEAEPLYQRSLSIFEKALGPDNPDVATSLNDLANLYAEEGKYAAAEPLLKRSLAIWEKTLGTNHPYVATSLNSLALLYWTQGKYADAEPFFERDLQNLSRQLDYSFSYMSEKDRLEFLQQAESTFPQYFSFCVAYAEKDPALTGKMYDALLWEKGLVGSSVASLRAQVAAAGDPQAAGLFDGLRAKKSESARLATSRPDGWRESRSHIDEEANDLEQQLARRVSSLAEQKSLARANWQDVQKTLAPRDAAVEFVRFPFHDGKKQTDKTYYVALVIRPRSQQPALVRLGEAGRIEGESFSAYRADVGSRSLIHDRQSATPPWRSLYDAVWKPLEASLGDAKRVYVSLDGALNELPLGVLQASDGRRVMEQYDVRMVSSTRDVLRPIHGATNNTAVVVGNPRFLLSDQEQRTAVYQMRGSGKQEQTNLLTPVALPSNAATGTLSRDLGERGACNPPPPAGGVLCPLPGTAAEVQSITELLREKNWSVSSYQGEQAVEEVVKNAARPRVLHLATHGFFLSDQQVKLGSGSNAQPSAGIEDPMLRSGLFFAGADRMLKSEPPLEGVENGVLTAYEAATLNLQGTELVVLSACETGRGQVQTGEGVFGLRRALQEAGAESVLMSLWSVPDRETQELMTFFYRNWLSGMEKPEALRRAQVKERDRVKKRHGRDLPFYWGAFILVGR
jgi:CHAT domain-containing protein/tetratricopeptide (TPR) repeat protein